MKIIISVPEKLLSTSTDMRKIKKHIIFLKQFFFDFFNDFKIPINLFLNFDIY